MFGRDAGYRCVQLYQACCEIIQAMGYLVGRVCHAQKADALNEVMTQVTPTIDKDGVLRHPVFNGQNWEYQGQPVNLNFPACNEFEYFELGHRIGVELVYGMVALLVVIFVKKAVLKFSEGGE